MLAKCSARGQCSRWSHIRGAPHHAVRAPHPTTHWGTARCEKTCLRRIDRTGSVIYEGFFTYTPGTSRYEPLAPPVRVPRMWGMERDPRASLGRRRARGDGLVMVFWALVVVVRWSRRASPWRVGAIWRQYLLSG